MSKKNLIMMLQLAACSLAGILLFLVLGELYLSAKGMPVSYKWGWRYAGDPHETNQLGFRGQPIHYQKADYVVLLIGDSQVEAQHGSYQNMPEKRLEQYLSALTGKSVKVFSIGTAGYGQDQELLALEEYFQHYSADMVVVWETLTNDVWNNMFPTHWPMNGTPKPTYWLDKNGDLMGPKKTGYTFRIESVIANIFLKSLWDDEWEKKYFPAPYKFHSYFHGKYLVDDFVLNKEAATIEHEKTHVGLALMPTSERTQYGMQLTQKLLYSMRDIAAEHKAKFITFADRRNDFPLPDGVYKVGDADRSIYPVLSRQKFWENADIINRGLNFFIVDVTLEEFRYKDDAHLNEAANNQVMRDLAIQLKDVVMTDKKVF